VENTVEAEMRVVDVLDTAADTVETGTRVIIVVVAFWAYAVPTRALKVRRMLPATIVVLIKKEPQGSVRGYGPYIDRASQR
jgi:hypothetical protein